MKKIITLFAALFIMLSVSAYDFTMAGIYYTITSSTGNNEVAVSRGTQAYSGSVTVPSTVTYNSVNYSVTALADESFNRCSSLTSINIPLSVTSIGNWAFLYCTGLTSVTIPSSVTTIGSSAFMQCLGLTSITIPSSVTSIGSYAFYGIEVLKSVTIPSSVTSIGSYTFAGCTGLTSVIIPSSITSISSGVFWGCSNLTSVSIPETVTSIGDGSFSYCIGLTSITIPMSVKSIGGSAFGFCTGLTSIICLNPEPPVTAANSFESVSVNKCKIYVPVGSKQKYEEAIGWDSFNYIIESGGIDVDTYLLAISSGESGAVELTLPKGNNFTCKIVPSSGWTINTVRFNGSDVTSQLYGQNQYTTPNLTENSTLSISFQSINSLFNMSKANEIKIYTEKNMIFINGAALGDEISVYTISGTLLKSLIATDEKIRISVPVNQNYLVKIAERSFKVASRL